MAFESRAAGNHSFAAPMVGPIEDVTMENFNAFGTKGDSKGHAECVLMTGASTTYPVEVVYPLLSK